MATGTANNTNTAYIQVVLEGDDKQELSTGEVRSAEVEDNDRLIDKATVVVDDPHGTIMDLFKERVTLRVDMGWGTEYATLFKGAVTQVPSVSQNGERQVKITAFDFSYRMMLGDPVNKSHTGKLSEIIERIVTSDPYNIPKGQIKVNNEPTFTKEKPLKQVHQRDWEFIQYLAFLYKARAYVEYNDGKSQFYFHPESQLLRGDRMGTLTYCQGFSQLIEFKFQRIASGADALRSAMAMDKDTGETVKSPPPPPKAPDKPDAPDPDKTAALAKISPQEATTYEEAQNALAKLTEPDQHPKEKILGASSDPDDLKRLVQQDPTRILGLFGEGKAVGTVKLRAKGKIGIQGISTWAEGDWYVRKAVHIYKRDIKDKEDHSTYYTKFVVTR